jgi:hypothetical protein
LWGIFKKPRIFSFFITRTGFEFTDDFVVFGEISSLCSYAD